MVLGKSCLLPSSPIAAEVVGDGAVVLRGVLEGLDRQAEAGGGTDLALVAAHLLDHGAVVVRIDHHRDVAVVLGRRADHGGAADVDVFDRIFEAAVGVGDGLLEGIQIDRHQVDAADAVALHDLVVGAAAAEDAAVHLRVQGLDASIHHLREAGVVTDFHHRDVVVAQQLGGAAGGKDFHAGLGEVAGEFDDAGLVGDADQCSGDSWHIFLSFRDGAALGHTCPGPLP